MTKLPEKIEKQQTRQRLLQKKRKEKNDDEGDLKTIEKSDWKKYI